MNIDPKSVKVSLHTGTPPTSPVQDVSWGSAEPVTVTVVHIGDEIFVRPDWDAYEMGRLAGVQAARDAVADCRVPWPTATGDLVNEGIDDALAAIDALPPKN